MRKLPPLNSIKAFEATARHLSFSKAAIELNVTAGAISQQVKALENTLGVTLFKRQSRLILLTEEGQACLPHISMGLDKISEGVSALYQYENKRPLTITLRLLQENKRVNSLMRFFIGKAWDAGNGHSLAKFHNAVLWETSSSP